MDKKVEINKICTHYTAVSLIMMVISMLIVAVCGKMIASIVQRTVHTLLAILLIIAIGYIACVAIIFGINSTYLCIRKAVDKSMADSD